MLGLLVPVLYAQWVDDPVNNTLIATTSADAGEIYLSTNEATGDTYVQWAEMASNGWAVNLQRIDADGYPQWGESGIHISSHSFLTWSSGTAMAATTDNAVVTGFQNSSYQCIAMKFNADGTYAWGEQGIVVFADAGQFECSRVELIAGNDGGVWIMASSYENIYLRYVEADGTLKPYIEISHPGETSMYGQLTLSNDNIVFLTYERIGSGMWYVDKQIWVTGYTTDGILVAPAEMLMGTQTFGMTYIHSVVPDGLGGGYAYIFHSGVGNVFNTYVFHFDANGHSTIGPNGATVHTQDPMNFYLNSDGDVDPISHDIVMVYRQTDAAYQSQCNLYMNRITMNGDCLWGEGKLVAGDDGIPYSNAKVDYFPDGSGFMVSYFHGQTEGMVGMTLEAVGYDNDGNVLWHTQMNNVMNNKSGDENNSGFHNGQNIVIWTNTETGNLYGQNIDAEGNMGPVVQPEPCLAPTNLVGEYFYNEETYQFGSLISWIDPDNSPLHYNLYRYHQIDKDEVIIEIPGSQTDYFDEVEPGIYTYRLTAVYEDCESDFALTPDGEEFIEVNVTSVEDHFVETDFEVIQIYTITGQAVNGKDLGNLDCGIYLVKGQAADGSIVTKKMIIDK